MVTTRSSQRRLTRSSWIDSALKAISKGGLDAVAVEPIAAELGATKGSFYHHFDSRADLLEATLAEWELRGTERVIEELESIPDPAERLRRLFMGAFVLDKASRAVEIGVLSRPDEPVARRAVQRVAQRRISYMALLLEQLGWDHTQALDRAVLIGYLYVGYLQANHVSPRVVSQNTRQRHVELIFDALVTGGLELK